MGEYPILDPTREAAMAKVNADKLLGKDDLSKANEEFAKALNEGNDREQDLLLRIVNSLEKVVSSIDNQASENQKSLKKLAGDVANELQRTVTSTSTSGEDIDKLAKRLGEVVTSPGRAEGSFEQGSQFNILQQMLQDFAQSITDRANTEEGIRPEFSELKENIAGKFDAGRPAPMVGTSNYEEPGAPSLDLSEQLAKPLEEIERSTSALVETVSSSISSLGDRLTSFMSEQGEQQEQREEENKAEAEVKEKRMADAMEKATKKGLLSGFMEPVQLLGLLLGSLIGLKKEFLQSMSIIGDTISDGWKTAKKWLEKIPYIGEYLAVLPDAIGTVRDDMSAVLKTVTDWWGFTKSEAELKKERADIEKVGGYKASQAVIKAGGPGAKLTSEALKEGLKPAHAAWFGTVVDSVPTATAEAYSEYKTAIKAGATPDEAFKVAQTVVQLERAAAKVDPSAKTTVAADSKAQGAMASESAATASALVEVKKSIEAQTAALKSKEKDKDGSHRGPVAMDTMGANDAAGMPAYLSGKSSGGTL